jgi:hypothetical protein
MAISVVDIASPVGEILYTDSALGNALSRVKTSSTALFYVTISNINNQTTPVFLKLFDAMAANITLGTTPPDLVFKVPGAAVANYVLYTGTAFGFTFTTALTAVCLLTGGSEGAFNPPPNPVSVLFSYV